MGTQIRHGDVLLIRVGDTPDSKTRREIVLAEGEATGHLHTLAGPLYIEKSGIVGVGNGGAVLNHPEHGALFIPAGRWEVRRQVEWIAQETRKVRD